MTIGVDLDEVLAELLDYCLFFHDYKINGKTIKKQEVRDYYIHHMVEYDLDFKQAIDWFRMAMNDDIGKCDIKPVSGALEGLKKLKNKGYTLKIITARPGYLFGEYTKKWVEKHYPNMFEEIYFASKSDKNFNHNGKDKTKKSDICKKLGIEIMIEDNPDYALELAENGIKTYLLEKPWNKGRCINNKNIVCVKSWDEINL